MSSSPPPIDDGTPMNVNKGQPELNGVSRQPPSHHHHEHNCHADDHPDNRQQTHDTTETPPPASPMQHENDAAASYSGDADNATGGNAAAVAIDSPDALPKLFRPVNAAKPTSGADETGKRTKGSVEAWSETDVYALPPTYPSMGKFVIISNKRFDTRTGMGERNGTDVDAESLYLRFKEFGFDVKVERDLKAKEIISLFQDMAKADHSKCAAFGCAILTHGEEGVIYGTDRQVEIDLLTKPFRGDRCKSLVGKPKIFFIQACRGSDLMDGVTVDAYQSDANTDITERLPVESDFLIAYSVVPGFFSWRNSIRGSWFIQALCTCLDKYGKSMDLLRLLTRVNKHVALQFESNTANQDMHKKKQIPCITSMLTKDFYLDPKALNLDGLP